ncbi:hypothetical protein ARMSODRAFT_1054888 [Armillaria solidipes]|uniref:Uncharacterized protein n=1 Tax=Armillaria solidipes TaxID=1076256 RepID=A0A2H3AZS1_9AGAR|nr:hypothetical protein ARMSODRAFT_1054888 [Armillaria solidipes]
MHRMINAIEWAKAREPQETFSLAAPALLYTRGTCICDRHEAGIDGAVGHEPEEPGTRMGRADEDISVFEFLDRKSLKMDTNLLSIDSWEVDLDLAKRCMRFKDIAHIRISEEGWLSNPQQDEDHVLDKDNLDYLTRRRANPFFHYGHRWLASAFGRVDQSKIDP